MASTLDLLKILTSHEVEFVIVGGVAGVLHGSRLVTQDVDVCAPLTLENLTRILRALTGLNPHFRIPSGNRPLPSDPALLVECKNLYLLTDLVQLDILSEIAGAGTYDEVARHVIAVDLGSAKCQVLDLDTLIRAKRAMNLPIIELETIRARVAAQRRDRESGDL